MQAEDVRVTKTLASAACLVELITHTRWVMSSYCSFFLAGGSQARALGTAKFCIAVAGPLRSPVRRALEQPRTDAKITAALSGVRQLTDSTPYSPHSCMRPFTEPPSFATVSDWMRRLYVGTLNHCLTAVDDG